MRTITTVGVFTLTSLGLAALLAWPREVVADRPEPFETLLRESLSFHTAYDDGARIVQVDADREIITVDFEDIYAPYSAMRVHWDGTDLWVARRGEPPQKLPNDLAVRVRQVWDEWRAGLPRSTVVEEEVSVTVPSYVTRLHHGNSGHSYRVTLPFAWADPYRVYVQTNFNGTLSTVHVTDPSTQSFFRVPGVEVPKQPDAPDPTQTRGAGIGFSLSPGYGVDYDVPLAPSTYSPEMAPREELQFTGRPYRKPWHERQQYVDLVRDPNVPGDARVWEACPTKDKTFVETASERWVMPTDPY